jgi:hypothetical protein
MVLLSNVIFYILFFPSEKVPEKTIPEDFVEIKLEAKLQTPFQKGKKVLFIHRKTQKIIEVRLQDWISEEEKIVAVTVDEDHAQKLIDLSGWEVLPHLKQFKFAHRAMGDQYEIHY